MRAKLNTHTVNTCMGQRTGTANLPLHGGRVPPWLATRMAQLGRLVTEAIVLEWGRDEFLRRMAHPFWFQSFGAVMAIPCLELLRSAPSNSPARLTGSNRSG